MAQHGRQIGFCVDGDALMDANYFYDPASDAERLRRKRKMAELLMMQSHAPASPLIDAGAFKVANWGDALGRVIDAWSAKHAAKDLADDEVKTAKAQADYVAGKTKEYQDALAGPVVGQDTRALDETGGSNPADVRGNPDIVRSLAVAMNSRIPDLQKRAKEDQDMREKLLSVPGATVSSRALASMRMDPNQLVEEPKRHSVNGQLVDNEGKLVADLRTKFGGPEPIPGAPPGSVGQTAEGTSEIKPLAHGPSTVVSIGDKRNSKVFEERVEAFGKRMPELAQARQKVDAFMQALPLIQGADTGMGAEQILAGRKLIKLLGGDGDKIATSEQLRSTLADLVFAEIKNLGSGTGISNTDLDFARRATLGQLQSDPRSLEWALRVATLKQVAKHKEHQQELEKVMNAFPDEQQSLSVYNSADPLTPWQGEIAKHFTKDDTGNLRAISSGPAPKGEGKAATGSYDASDPKQRARRRQEIEAELKRLNGGR